MSRFTSPKLDTADSVQVTPIVKNPVGVNTFLEQEVDTELRRRTVEMVRDAGIGWMRQQFPWDNIEPVEKGRYIDRVIGVDTWEKYDAIVNLSEEYGPTIDRSTRYLTAMGTTWQRLAGDSAGEHGRLW